MRFKDLTGQRFGTLVVLYPLNIISKNKKWVCKCDCGNIKEILGYQLTSGKTKSCGCKTKLMISEKIKKHGMTNTRFFNIWQSMKRRATHNIEKCYNDVSICDRWLIFNNFKDDMHKSYQEHVKIFGEKQTTIDRIDPFGDYNLKNCRWATFKEQSANKREVKSFKAISPKNIEYIFNNISEFAKQNNLNNQCITHCLKLRIKQHKGWRFNYV